MTGAASCLVPRAWWVLGGAWCRVPGAWWVPGAWCRVPGAWWVPGSWYLVLGRTQGICDAAPGHPGTKSPLRTRDRPGTADQTRTRYPPGTRHQAPGTTRCTANSVRFPPSQRPAPARICRDVWIVGLRTAVRHCLR
ncbi:MAG: hypothetical protein C5B57_02090 [Blastocatellia bacterium]|nr:MAG: hypothetical protein C5B57_02090 [Blastocatellia bacterium]